MGTHRDFLDVENRCNFSRREAFYVPQHQACAFARRKQRKSSADQFFPLFESHQALGIRPRIGVFDSQFSHWPSLPMLIVADIDRHTVEPGSRIRIEIRVMPKKPQEHFLRGILCILQIAKQPIGGSEDHLAMRGYQFVQRRHASQRQPYR